MVSTHRRMIAVAMLVCGFAVGMAGLLNYFKYRSTELRLVKERLLVTGRSIESGIQSALALGLQFGDIGTLPGTLERERATDNLILSIDVFGVDGRLLYSTDRLRTARPVPAAWMAATKSKRTGKDDWFVEAGNESAAGMSIENNFGLAIGYVALRYSYEQVEDSIHDVGRQLALASLVIFVLSASLSSLALLAVMRRLSRDVTQAEAALKESGSSRRPAQGSFGSMLNRFTETVRQAEDQIADVRSRLQRGAVPIGRSTAAPLDGRADAETRQPLEVLS